MKSPYSIATLTLLAGATLFSAGAWSAPPAGAYLATRSEIFEFDAGVAATPEGAAGLYAKLTEAAARVCTDPNALPKNVSAGREYTACVEQAVNGAVTTMREPMVSMIHLFGLTAATAAVAKR